MSDCLLHTLVQNSAGIHSCFEFLVTVAGSCPDDGVFTALLLFLYSSCFYILSVPSNFFLSRRGDGTESFLKHEY